MASKLEKESVQEKMKTFERGGFSLPEVLQEVSKTHSSFEILKEISKVNWCKQEWNRDLKDKEESIEDLIVDLSAPLNNKAVTEEDINVKRAAIEYLHLLHEKYLKIGGYKGAIVEKAIVESSVKVLKDTDYNARDLALSVLNGIGPDAKEAVPALIEGLKDNTTFLSTKYTSCTFNDVVLSTLCYIKPHGKEVVTAVVELLQSEEYSTRGGAANVLGGIEEDADNVVRALVEALKDETNEYAGDRIIGALGKLGSRNPKLIPEITRTLKEVEEDYQFSKTPIITALKHLEGISKEPEPQKQNMLKEMFSKAKALFKQPFSSVGTIEVERNAATREREERGEGPTRR